MKIDQRRARGDHVHMTTQTLTLTDFLLARIAEEEAGARAAFSAPDPGRWEVHKDPQGEYLSVLGQLRRDVPVDPPSPSLSEGCWHDVTHWDAADGDWPEGVAAHIARYDPARVLRDCKARRVVISMEPFWTGPDPFEQGQEHMHGQVLRALSLSYVDHPDYRPEWRS